VGFKCSLDAVICGVEIDAVICGVDLVAINHGVEMSARSAATSNRSPKLDAVDHGVNTCNNDAAKHGVDP
jgi:hypothetical protein